MSDDSHKEGLGEEYENQGRFTSEADIMKFLHEEEARHETPKAKFCKPYCRSP